MASGLLARQGGLLGLGGRCCSPQARRHQAALCSAQLGRAPGQGGGGHFDSLSRQLCVFQQQQLAQARGFLQGRLRWPGQDRGLCAAIAVDGGSGGGGGSSGAGGRQLGGDGEGEEEGGEGSEELLSRQQAEELAAAKGIELPADFLAEASAGGLRRSALEGFAALQKLGLAAWLSRLVPAFRDRLIEDPRFLFKVLSEVSIDCGCATVAEVRKRGADFWNEFEFYLSDLIVGIVLDVVLVSLLAPVAVLGARPRAASATGMGKVLARVPSAVFAPSVPGAPRYTVADRAACLGVKFLEYSLAGMACGFVGQGVANGLMQIKRNVSGHCEGDVCIPPLGMTALTWGLFMGVSSNVRYQIVYGIEHLVDVTVARKVPAIAYATTLIVRFANNVIGGEQFIDMARWTGIQ